jgi:hypothetical protein
MVVFRGRHRVTCAYSIFPGNNTEFQILQKRLYKDGQKISGHWTCMESLPFERRLILKKQKQKQKKNSWVGSGGSLL